MSTNRSANIKESKEKKNREKLLAGPGSEYSLANPEEMEMDYYDYNVINAGAAPGSYLGMDPAYLVWIPPLDDSSTLTSQNYENSDHSAEEENDTDDTEPHYEEISTSYTNLPKATIVLDDVPTLSRVHAHKPNDRIENSRNVHNAELNKIKAASAFKELPPKSMSSRRSSAGSNKSPVDSIQLKEFQTKKSNNYRYVGSPAKVHRPLHNRGPDDNKDNDIEKETAVVKSPSDDINEYYELDDIQFADEEDDDIDEVSGERLGQCDNRSTFVTP